MSPPPAVDPTLRDADGNGAEATGEFPDTASGTQLVLYQAGNGGVELRWHLAPAAIAQARRVVSDASARPLLRLRLFGGDDGSTRTLADADLNDDAAAASGLAVYGGEDAEGRLVAEIGLATRDGGWLLIARSNDLSAAAPVGAAFVRDAWSVEPRQANAGQADAGWPEVALDDGESPAVAVEPPLRMGHSPAQSMGSPAASNQAFPLVEPELSGLEPAGSLALSGPVAGSEQSTATDSTETPSGVVVPRLQRTGPEGALPQAGHSGQSPTEPGPVTSGTPGKTTPGGPEPSQAAAGAATVPVAGSGPVQHGASDLSLSAELVLRGSAPPHTVFDLNGHPYRVGPGGRFELRVPVRDRELIRRLLSTLPGLPVVDRDSD